MSIRRLAAAGLTLSLTAPLFGTGAASAAPPSDTTVIDAGDWLLTQQKADGGFEVAGVAGFETPDAVLAFAGAVQAGQGWAKADALDAVEGLDSAEGKDPLDYLDDLVDNESTPTSPAAAGRAAKIIALVAEPLGIAATDFDPSDDSANAVDLLARVTANLGENEDYAGLTFNGKLYTVLALRASGQAVPDALTEAILAGQRPDGSWDYTGMPNADGGGNDIDTTAVTLLALRADNVRPGTEAVDDAVTWLAQQQGASGAFKAFGADDPNATAMATIALSALHIDVTTPAWRTAAGVPVTGAYPSPYAALRAMANADGHINSPNDSPEWGTNTFATSQAMQALTRQVHLRGEREVALRDWSRKLASPAAAPDPTAAGALLSDTLGPNPSIKSARLAATTAAVTGQKGREAAAADLFKQAFNRTIDPSGRTYWSNKLTTITRPEMLARLTGSSEYYRKAGGTVPKFVDAVYQSVLGRTADPSGRTFWINQLNKGRSVESVARTLVASSEYRRTQVKNTFQLVLERQPSAGERDYWTTKIATTRIEVLLAALAASAEFYDVTIS